jgi:hypothetical protein
MPNYSCVFEYKKFQVPKNIEIKNPDRPFTSMKRSAYNKIVYTTDMFVIELSNHQ